MTYIKFNCPACDQSIEAPHAALLQGATCPTCKTDFIPDPKKFSIVPSKESNPVVKPFVPNPQFEKEYHAGDGTKAVAWLCAIFAAVALIIAFANSQDTPTALLSCEVAGAFIFLALMLGILAQLIRIRAAVEKKK